MSRILQRMILGLIRLYQFGFSRWTPRVCRFEPTCSTYTAECVHRFGAARGTWLGIKRICRCHPFNEGGFDPPPAQRLEVSDG